MEYVANWGEIIASYRETAKQSISRLYKILSSPEARAQIAQDGLPILKRQRFMGITAEVLLKSIESYHHRLEEAIANQSIDPVRDHDDELAIRALAYLNAEDYEAKQYAVVVVDDVAQGVWDRETFQEQWYKLSGRLNHKRYQAEYLVTEHLSTIKIQEGLTCSSTLWDKQLAERAVLVALKEKQSNEHSAFKKKD